MQRSKTSAQVQRTFNGTVLFLLLCLFILSPSISFGATGDEESAEAPAGLEKETPEGGKARKKKKVDDSWVIDGYARFGIRHRFTREYVSGSPESDRDILGLLSLDIRDCEKKERFSFHLLGNFNWDIDGITPSGGSDPFNDVYDSYVKDLQAQLFSAYVKSTRPELKCKFFLGRQSIYKGEALDFDGLRVEHRPSRNLALSLFGGIPVNYFESSHLEDKMVGGGAEVGIPKKVSLRCDYIRIRDTRTYEPGSPVAKDDLFVGSFKYTALKPFSLYAIHSRLEGRERRTLVRAKWLDKKNGFLAALVYVRQGMTLTNYSTELSPFYIVLAEYAPFFKFKGLILKDLHKNVQVECGFEARQLYDEADEGVLNHSYGRYYGAIHLVKLCEKKVDATLSYEFWNASGRNDKSVLEAEVKYKATKELKLGAGTDFALFKYDYEFTAERENVRSFFAKAEYKLSKKVKVRAKVALEQDDAEDYYLIHLSFILSW